MAYSESACVTAIRFDLASAYSAVSVMLAGLTLEGVAKGESGRRMDEWNVGQDRAEKALERLDPAVNSRNALDLLVVNDTCSRTHLAYLDVQ